MRMTVSVLTIFFSATFAPADVMLGEPAPEWVLRDTPHTPDTPSQRLADLKGNVVVMTFLTTWCQPCIRSVSTLNYLAGECEDEPVRFVTIVNEDQRAIDRFLKKHQLDTRMYADDDGATRAAYGSPLVPQTYIIDEEGLLVAEVDPLYLRLEHVRAVLSGEAPKDLGNANRIRHDHDGTEGVSIVMSDAQCLPHDNASVMEKGTDRGPNMIRAECVSAEWLVHGVYRPREGFRGLWRRVGFEHLPDGLFSLEVSAPSEDMRELSVLAHATIESYFGVNIFFANRAVPVVRLERIPGEPHKMTEHPADALGQGSSGGSGRLDIASRRFSMLVEYLEADIRLPVIDDTGLAARYTAQASIPPDAYRLRHSDPQQYIAAWRDAFYEQLGLRLVEDVAEIEVLVIEPRE